MSEFVVHERSQILMFTMDCLRDHIGGRLFMREIFAAYHDWRKAQGLKPTHVSIVGFGKFFPEGYSKKKLGRGGEIERGIEGYKLVKS